MADLEYRNPNTVDELPVLMRTGDPTQRDYEYFKIFEEQWSQLCDLRSTGCFSAYSNSCTLAVDPVYATTNTGRDAVDLAWVDGSAIAFSYVITSNAIPADPNAFATVLADLREKLDLPVADVAAMCGVKRRQMYNLLSGRMPPAWRERFVRALHRVVTEIDDAAGGDRANVRAAVLLPIGTTGETVYSAACAGDEVALTAIGSEVAARTRARAGQTAIARPSPRLAGLVSGERAVELLHDHRPPGDSDTA